MDSDKDGKVSRAEFDAAHADKAGMFDEIDTDKDGFMDADEAKAHHEGRCGSDKKADGAKSADKTGMEGKCGEGKCEIGRAPSELQSLMRNSYAVFCSTKKTTK